MYTSAKRPGGQILGGTLYTTTTALYILIDVHHAELLFCMPM